MSPKQGLGLACETREYLEWTHVNIGYQRVW